MNPVEEYYDRYGDKIILDVIPRFYDTDTASEEEQRQRARDFVDRYTVCGKPARIGYYGAEVLTEAYSEELYRYSRICLAK